MWDVVWVFLSAVAAGGINSVVGSGTLVTFPTLLAVGFDPVSANVSNSLGLVFGGATATWGYRRELSGRWRTVRSLLPVSASGALVGAVLLLALPADTFEAVVPVLIVIAVFLVLVQPWWARSVARRQTGTEIRGRWRAALLAGVFLTGVYGGYFGAAQGVLLIGLLGVLLTVSLQEVVAVKNVLGAVVNGLAAVVFLVVSPQRIDGGAVAVIAVGSLIGGALGAGVGRRLSPVALRAVIVMVGAAATVSLSVS
ncbi:MAG: uncharacterized protein QG608_1530 [Actinomycetota bacterium]|nr:uncharacterized protein [Actinomycetota bacterium]